MGTLIRNNGLMFDGANLNRWLTQSELFYAHGWPVTTDAQAAARTSCHFALNHSPPSSRTRRSATGALGNAMHINTMGAYSFFQ
eukprot:3916477-Lingulodinium_polyedra.AAC.1